MTGSFGATVKSLHGPSKGPLWFEIDDFRSPLGHKMR